MSYTLRFEPKSGEKTLRTLKPAVDEVAVAAAIMELVSDPFRPDLDTRRMSGRGDYRLPVRSWRVIYELDTKNRVVTVTSIANRRDAYRR